LWWDLEAIAHWGAGLERVLIVGGSRADAPGRAGDRLLRFISTNLPAANVETEWIEKPSSQSVRDAIGKRLSDQSLAWIVSGAGGTRSMSLGAYLASADHPHSTFVLRDEDDGWRRVDDGVEHPLAGLDPRATDVFAAADLLRVTWADERFEVVVRPTSVEPEIDAAAQRSVAGSPWRTEFEAATYKLRNRTGSRHGAHGFLFERFVLATVRALGVHADDVLIGSLLTHGAQRVQEVDVVVNSGGRLHVIDCKLSSTGGGVPPAVQLREGDATGHHLADGAEQYILLRPNWVVDQGIAALAQRLGIQILDRTTLTGHNPPDLLAVLLRPAQNLDVDEIMGDVR
jgi:hypothetical protein